MSRICNLTGKKTIFGNSVSHSNNKVKRKFLPNLKWHKFLSNDGKKCFRLRVSKKGLRLVDKFGIEKFFFKLNIKK